MNSPAVSEAGSVFGDLTLAHVDPRAFIDLLWARLRAEAEDALQRAPRLGPLFLDAILNQTSFEAAVIRRVATRLSNDLVSLPLMVQAFRQAMAADPAILTAMACDIAAVCERDSSYQRFIEPFLYCKGFHALQAHRLSHWLSGINGRDLSDYLQSRSSQVFQTDINPAARFGRGIFLGHATGLVVGETAVVADCVSILHGVTLGGTGKEAGDRHPKIGRGVTIGSGAKILGNIEIGENACVATGAVVLRAVPAHANVAGVPARVVAAEMSRPI
jgi:serine O-acetyltransferase